MPRLFTGLEIPSEIAYELSLLRGGIYGARWIDVENYHITLRFIGDIDHATASDVFTMLDRVRRKSFTVTLEELTSFGGDRPRAIVAKAQAAQPLIDLHSDHERIMQRIGMAPEPRKYTPHVTLARLKTASPMAVADYLSTRGFFFFSRRFEATRFVLFSSRDSVGGGPYVVEAAFPLG